MGQKPMESLRVATFRWSLFLVVVSVAYCNGQIPANPCPQIFQYVQENGIIFGRIELPTDYTGTYELAVNVSLATLLRNQNIALKLLTSIDDLNRGANPVYRIVFPIQNVLPKVTQILFNGKSFCWGPQEPVTSRGVTNMWAQTILITNIIPTNNRPNQGYQRPMQPVQQVFQRPSPTNPNPPFHFFTIPSEPPTVPFTVPTIQTTTTPRTKPTQTTLPSAPFTSVPARPNVDKRVEGEECGVFSQQLIVGGTDVQKGQFPWLVAIFQNIASTYLYKCTGNLISKRHVISAGHCFKFETLDTPKDDFTCVLGKQDISNWAYHSTIVAVKEINVHPEYRPNSGDYDIAIVTMDKPMSFNENIKPLCLWDQNDSYNVIGRTGTVVGWGTDGKNEHTSIAKKIDLSIVSNEDCLRSHWGFANITSSRTFCAGGKGVGPCSGDSGAGILMQRNGLWTLRGIVTQALQAKGEIICDLGKYIVFADVKSYIPWIRQMISK